MLYSSAGRPVPGIQSVNRIQTSVLHPQLSVGADSFQAKLGVELVCSRQEEAQCTLRNATDVVLAWDPSYVGVEAGAPGE